MLASMSITLAVLLIVVQTPGGSSVLITVGYVPVHGYSCRPSNYVVNQVLI